MDLHGKSVESNTVIIYVSLTSYCTLTTQYIYWSKLRKPQKILFNQHNPILEFNTKNLSNQTLLEIIPVMQRHKSCQILRDIWLCDSLSLLQTFSAITWLTLNGSASFLRPLTVHQVYPWVRWCMSPFQSLRFTIFCWSSQSKYCVYQFQTIIWGGTPVEVC